MVKAQDYYGRMFYFGLGTEVNPKKGKMVMKSGSIRRIAVSINEDKKQVDRG